LFFDRLPGTGYVCAHRGARTLAPENTMLAAELALEVGADYWEMDVQKVADGSLIVFHDDYLPRTTDVASRREFANRSPWQVSSFTLDELQQLNAGSWFADDSPYSTIVTSVVDKHRVKRMKEAKISTLKEALAFSRHNDFPINVEIKDQIESPGDLSIVKDVLKVIRKQEAEDLVLISSFNHAYLAEVHRLIPEIPLAVLVEDKHPEDIVGYLGALGSSVYHPDIRITDIELVRTLTKAGIKVAPWTMNYMDQAVDFIDAGCFGIITDYAHTLRQRLDARDAWSDRSE